MADREQVDQRYQQRHGKARDDGYADPSLHGRITAVLGLNIYAPSRNTSVRDPIPRINVVEPFQLFRLITKYLSKFNNFCCSIISKDKYT